MKILSRIFATIVAFYGLSTVVILLLRLLVGERWVVIAMLNVGVHLVLMPALILFPLALVLRWPRIACLYVPALLTLVSNYAISFLPHTIALPPDAVRFTLLTYNLHAETTFIQPLVDVIQDAGADIVVLQELSAAAAEVFDRQFADEYPNRLLFPVSSPYHGRGILSRFPLSDNEVWPEEYPIPVRLQRVTVTIQDRPLTLYNMHAPPSNPLWEQPFDHRPRTQQLADLLAMGREVRGALVLAGDFNINEFDENYRRIAAAYSDSFREVGWGLGFTGSDWSHDYSREGPAYIPLHQRFDYVFHNAALIAVEAQVWPASGGSDHRPLLVELALTAP